MRYKPILSVNPRQGEHPLLGKLLPLLQYHTFDFEKSATAQCYTDHATFSFSPQ